MKNFGYELILDLIKCNSNIKKEDKLKKYVKKLCKKIEMKAYGEPILEYFGLEDEKTKGFTIVQLIETSSIVGHFSEAWKTAHINVFSCKYFDQEAATEFTEKFFKAKVLNKVFLERNGE